MILIIAPLPPPIHGQSLATQVFLDGINNDKKIVLDTSKKSHKEGISSFKRVLEVIRIFLELKKTAPKADLIYMHISESIGGNLKDIICYLLIGSKIRNTVLHLHGGSLKREVFEKSMLLRKLNRYYFKKVQSIIILGKSHRNIFMNMLDKNKICIVPNFAEDYLFISEKRLRQKFENFSKIKLLYLSNLIEGKGYKYLLDSIENNTELLENFQINFAGGFDSEEEREVFQSRIETLKNVYYHGIVEGSEKKELLNSTHLFCLPTLYNEGQPISILEAYASACMVMVTKMGGIVDIFEDGVNGYLIQPKSAKSISDKLALALLNKHELIAFGSRNYKIAKSKYRTSIYQNKLKEILNLKKTDEK